MCRHYNFPGTETRGEEKPQKRATREEEDSRSNDDASSDRVAPRSTRVGVTVGGGKKEDDVLLSRSIRFIGVVQSIRMMSSSLFVFIRGKGETRFPAFFVFTENAPWGASVPGSLCRIPGRTEFVSPITSLSGKSPLLSPGFLARKLSRNNSSIKSEILINSNKLRNCLLDITSKKSYINARK